MGDVTIPGIHMTEKDYEQLSKDAARYRWLRVHSTGPSEPWSSHSNPESLDAIIDAKMDEESL